jgi:hypothetical protein
MSDPGRATPPLTDSCPNPCIYNPDSNSKKTCVLCQNPHRLLDFYDPDNTPYPLCDLRTNTKRFFQVYPSFRFVAQFLRKVCIISDSEMYYEELCVRRLKLKGVNLQDDLRVFIRVRSRRYLEGLDKHKNMLYTIMKMCSLYDIPIVAKRKAQHAAYGTRYYIDLPPENPDEMPLLDAEWCAPDE